MTSLDVIPTERPLLPQSINAKTNKPLKVTGRVSDALNRMIELGETYQQAAQAVGLHVRVMRKAIDKPHVLNELRRRKQVFRAAISAANISRLAAIRDQDDNKQAAVNAIKVLEQIDDDPARSAASIRMPGITIQIVQQSAHMVHERESEPKPLITHDAGSDYGENR